MTRVVSEGQITYFMSNLQCVFRTIAREYRSLALRVSWAKLYLAEAM